ncbi:MAG: nucleoside recognition domain-containing protein [Peptostreptococcales bacterium]
MNVIWIGLALMSIVVGMITGHLKEINEAFLKSCDDAVFFTIGLMGIMALWSGFMNIAKEAKLIDKIAQKSMPVFNILFPKEKNKETLSLITMNIIMNMFGAGNSATVFGIKAMESLDKNNHFSKKASTTMCMFLVINMSSVQLIPITVMKIRNDAGSIDPADIILPGLIATAISTIVGILFCKYFEGRDRCK